MTDLFMERCELIGEDAMFVHQEAEPPLLLQQCLPTSVSNKLLHVHLTMGEGLQTLGRENDKKIRNVMHAVIGCGRHTGASPWFPQ